ncbi:HNH endonuclease [Ktedonobacter robiniae]|uniref:HNH nuclease domain-containing protein n=1 Tax=Ktedonobacter robiniae TaxID=2778365 RepID=A0ABQ3UKG0_9CHLR|nr:HNH endonuclease signature motif containing protein [Ktedonobacter robiniae]GHO52885.1 hypothetical protein KSB_13600 [Ktedonobacter robiniae]
MFVKNQEYKRTDIHEQFGGQGQGGISTPAHQNIILLFTSNSGRQYGYSDGWTNEGIFLYAGEGQQGDMKFTRGNAALRDHVMQGKDLHLFTYVRKGFVCYIGQMVCTGFRYDKGPDASEQIRERILFELVPLDFFSEAGSLNENLEREATTASLTLADLRSKALSNSVTSRTPTERKIAYYYRSQAIKDYALKRAEGICEGCNQTAPFITKEDQPYLEVHHIRRLSDGGPDDPQWVIAICPNCHRRAHYAKDSLAYNQYLGRLVKDKEAKLAFATI